MRMFSIVFMALCILPLHAMERDQRSNHNEQPLSTAIKVLEVTGDFFSLLESVVGNLHQQDALKVATLKSMLDAADSPWRSGLVYGMEKVVGITPEFAIPYLQRVAGACHTQGTGFIHFLVEQKKEKKSLSDLLRSVRHGSRYLAPNRDTFNKFLSSNEVTINTVLKDYYPVLPALGAGVRAMHTSLAERDDPDSDAFYDAQEDPDDITGSSMELQDCMEVQDGYEALYWRACSEHKPASNKGMSWWCG